MATMSRRFARSSALDRTNTDVIPRCAIAHRGCATRTRVYPSSAISLSKSATADLDAQARNPYSPSWLWIPGSRFARPGMTDIGAPPPQPPPQQRKLRINTDKLGWRPLPLHHREWFNLMKIGTLLTVAIVSLSAVGGGLAVYVATTKYQTMDKVSVAQRRLEIVRAVGEIPRYMNPERRFATNIMFGPPAVDPKLRAELNDKYRKQTEGAREKMNQIKATLL